MLTELKTFKPGRESTAVSLPDASLIVSLIVSLIASLIASFIRPGVYRGEQPHGELMDLLECLPDASLIVPLIASFIR